MKKKFTAAALAIGVTFGTGFSVAGATAEAATVPTIHGTLKCKSYKGIQQAPVGLWVESDNHKNDGFVKLGKPQPQLGGYASSFSHGAPGAKKFRLSVGCGGSAKKWGKTIKTGWLSPKGYDLAV